MNALVISTDSVYDGRCKRTPEDENGICIKADWMADVSRLTLWMKQSYHEQEYELFRNVFLKHYRTSYRKDEFDVFENAYHVYSALDSLIFSVRVGNTEMESRLKRYLEEKANED